MKKTIIRNLSAAVLCLTVFGASQAMAQNNNFSLTLPPNGSNRTVCSGPKDDANNNFSHIRLDGGTVDHVNAWVVNSKGKMLSDKKRIEKNSQTQVLKYVGGNTAAKGESVEIRIEQNNVKSKTAHGWANTF